MASPANFFGVCEGLPLKCELDFGLGIGCGDDKQTAPEYLPMIKTHVLGPIVCALSFLAMPMAKLWNCLAIHCSYCCHSVAGDTVGTGEKMAWCPRCQQVFETPLLKAPSWVTGVLAILLINV